MNAKWTIDFRVRVKPKLLEEKNWRKSLRPQVRQPFLRYMNKSTVHIRKKKLDFIKMKMFCTSKYSMKELKTSNRLRKILANPIKDLYWDYILIHLEKHLKWAKYLNSNFIQKRYANDWYSHEKMATSLTEASSCCPLMWEQHVVFRSRLTVPDPVGQRWLGGVEDEHLTLSVRVSGGCDIPMRLKNPLKLSRGRV